VLISGHQVVTAVRVIGSGSVSRGGERRTHSLTAIVHAKTSDGGR